jgi:hypothetical protein
MCSLVYMRVYLESYTCFSVLISENATIINLEWMDYLRRHILVCIFTDFEAKYFGSKGASTHFSIRGDIYSFWLSSWH